MKMLDTHNRRIGPVWAAEFRGFFWADGCLEIGRYHRTRGGKRHAYFRPRAGIVQRDDNRELLETIQARLGGFVTHHGSRKIRGDPNGVHYVMRPTIAWKATSTADLRRVISVLRDGILPHMKQRQLDVMEQFLDKRHKRGHKYTPRERQELEALRKKMADLHKYVKC